jgi:aspartate kinase
MSLVVMKFGGTSVEDAVGIKRAGEIVASRQARGQQVVVVVSAMARVTDQLHAAAVSAGNGDKAGALAMSARLRNRHLEAARELLSENKHGAEQWLDAEFVTLDELLRGIAAVGELTPRTLDLVLSYGERVSSRLIAESYAAQSLNGWRQE